MSLRDVFDYYNLATQTALSEISLSKQMLFKPKFKCMATKRKSYYSYILGMKVAVSTKPLAHLIQNLMLTNLITDS